MTALAASVVALAWSPLLTTASQAFESPVAFSATALPTWQTNGVVYALASAQGRVFVGGKFSYLQPPNGTNGTGLSRVNFAVMDAVTGAPVACKVDALFTATSGVAVVRSLDVSPDGHTLYVGGYFNRFGGMARQNLAALNIDTCTVNTSFQPTPNDMVRGLDASDTAVYLGGSFTQVGGASHLRAAAVRAVGTPSAGTVIGAFSPSLSGAFHDGLGPDVNAVQLKPDGSVLVVGGRFDTVNGLSSHALAVVNPGTGNTVKTFANFIPGYISTIAKGSAVKSIAVDDTGFYTGNEGTGKYVFDGRIAVDWDGYTQRWRDTCLGATQAVLPHDGLLYSASHAHDCSGVGAYGDGRRHHLLAETLWPAAGPPALVSWSPDTNDGSGEGIGPRALAIAVAGWTEYLWAGGEFTEVNGRGQRGLTRFGGNPSAGPDVPELAVTSTHSGQVRVAWRTAVDPDDGLLTYRVYRDGDPDPVRTTTASSLPWDRPQVTWIDTGLPGGSTHSYRVTATDGENGSSSATRSVTVASTSSSYESRIASDGPLFHLRYDESSGPFVSDSSGQERAFRVVGTPGFRAGGAISGDPSRALTFTGTSNYLVSEHRFAAPTTFSLETWFRTSTALGGKLIGFGDSQELESQVFDTRSSERHIFDKQLYMTTSGQLMFGTEHVPGVKQTVMSPRSYRDNVWHFAVATQDADGMSLYVDGIRVAHNTAALNGNGTGFWRVGGDTLKNWPYNPGDGFFAGSLDETAVYDRALTQAEIASHLHVVPDTVRPSTPTGLAAEVTDDAVTLSWTPSTDGLGIAGYDVHRSPVSGFAPTDATRIGVATGPSYVDVPDSGTWFYRVAATDVAGNPSLPSAQVSALTGDPTPATTVVTISPTSDGLANSGAPGTNYGTDSSLSSNGRPAAASYLRFAFPTAPAGTALSGAVLRLRTTTTASAGSAVQHALRVAGNGWTESGLTWNNRPAIDGAVLGAIAGAKVVNSPFGTVLAPVALESLLGTTATVGVSSTGSDGLYVWSRNAGTTSYRPQLVLTFSPLP